MNQEQAAMFVGALDKLAAAIAGRPDLQDTPDAIKASYWHIRYHQALAEIEEERMKRQRAEQRADQIQLATDLLAEQRDAALAARDEQRAIVATRDRQIETEQRLREKLLMQYEQVLEVVQGVRRAETPEEGQTIQAKARELLESLEGERVTA